MGQPEEKVASEFWQFMSKVGLGALYIIPAVVAKIAAESIDAKLGWKKIIIKVVLSCCVGAFAYVACMKSKLPMWTGAVIVPVATMIGESFVRYLLTNSTKIFDTIIGRWLNGKKKDNGTP